MAEEVVLEEKKVDAGFDPFSTAPLPEEVKAPEVKVEEKQPEVKAEVKAEPVVEVKQPEAKTEVKTDAEIKKEVAELDPAVRDKFFNDTYDILSQKKEIEKAANLDLSKVSDARRILELDLKIKNRSLDSEEIKDEIADRFEYPEKPEQDEMEDTDKFEVRMNKWKDKVDKIDKRIIREAKLAKPEIEKYNTGLKIPEIPKSEVVVKNEPTQEDLDRFETLRNDYLKSIETGVKGLNDFTVTAQDKDVPVSVAWKVEDAEKTTLHERFTDFDHAEFLQSRWLTKEGKFNGAQQAKDVYILENFDKMLQKSVNDAVAQTKLHYEKMQKNIDLKEDGVSRGTFQPETKSETDKMAEFFFNN